MNALSACTDVCIKKIYILFEGSTLAQDCPGGAIGLFHFMLFYLNASTNVGLSFEIACLHLQICI